MTAQELRIGNICNFICDNEVIKIQGISPNKDFDDQIWIDYTYITDDVLWSATIDEFEFIPLTEEWLLKFGFQYRGIYYHFPNNDIFKLEQYKNKNAFWLRYGTESIDCTRINYVHQLQNLYFALTGKELNTQQL